MQDTFAVEFINNQRSLMGGAVKLLTELCGGWHRITTAEHSWS